MFKYVILLSAILLAVCSAWFSVTGIAQLFSQTFGIIFIAACAMELAKIVGISFMYRYWKTIPRLLKTYMTISSVVLLLITSIGVYGYLTAGYASTLQGANVLQTEIALHKTQVQTIDESILRLKARSDNVQSNINLQESRMDELTRQSRSVNVQQRYVRQQTQEIKSLLSQIDTLTQRKDSLNTLIATKTIQISSTGKIGTFYYVADMMGVSLDTIVKWFTILIVLVLDPMSISLFIAYNMLSTTKLRNEIPTITPIEPVPESTDINSEDTPVVVDDSIPYYRKPGFEWAAGGTWEHDPSALAWKNLIERK